MSQNVSFLEGNVANVPQLKMHKNAAGEDIWRCWFKIAVTRLSDRGKPRDEQRTSFISIVTWGDAAKQHAQFIGNGDLISVVGEQICDSKLKPGSTTEYDEFHSIDARDIQYLMRAQKNHTVEQLQERVTASLARIEELRQGAGAATAPHSPAATAIDLASLEGDGNPFTEDGKAPAGAYAA